MADNDSDQEKTEEATPRRKSKAREEGQVPRSRELTTFLLLLGGVGGLWGMGQIFYDQLGMVMEQASCLTGAKPWKRCPCWSMR